MNMKTRRDEERKKVMMNKKSSQDMRDNFQGISKKDKKNNGHGLGQRTKFKSSPY